MRALALAPWLLFPAVLLAAVPDGRVVLVEAGTHKLLRERLSVERVAVGNPAVADVNVINRRELLVSGVAEGVTSLLVWYKDLEQAREYRLVVGPVENPLARSPDGDGELAAARVSAGRLDGVLPNLAAHRRARVQAGEGAADNAQVAMPNQVLTEIRIAELSRSTLRQFGLNFLVNRLNLTAALTTPGTLSGAALGAPGGDATAPITLGATAPIQDAFNIVLGDASRNVLGFLSLLEGQGLVRTLAEPSLTATSGQTATFLAGGEFPVPIAQGSNSGISVEYKEFGVRLSLTPTVLSPQRIALKVAPEVSELDFRAGIQLAGATVPALTVRRTDTTVELGDGESFVISGLVSRNMLANVDKIPFLGSVPILGAFFRSTRYDRNEKELIMVVTPHLVQPIRAGAELPSLPGADYDGYDPGSARLMLLESGRFKTGMSR